MKPEQLSAKVIQENIEEHIKDIEKEFRSGFNFLKKYPKSISIFGSARTTSESPHYQMAQLIARRVVSEIGYAVITGGGPGIMEAGNRGAQEGKELLKKAGKDAGNASLGISIRLPHEQSTNKFVDDEEHFDYFFARKAMLTFAAEAYLFFPGGFGTFDELFGIITLIQTRKIPRVPIILVGDDFWKPLAHFIKHQMLEVHHTISLGDESLFVISENPDTILNIIKNAPIANWWEMMD